MKKILLVLSFIFLLTGCAALGSWTDAQARCAQDPECMAQAKGYAKIGEAVGSGFGPVVAAGAGAVITYLAFGILGLKKKKEGQ